MAEWDDVGITGHEMAQGGHRTKPYVFMLWSRGSSIQKSCYVPTKSASTEMEL